MTEPAIARTPRRAEPPRIRDDLRLVADMVTPNARVLDIGCGKGELLSYLAHTKNVDARGIELSQAGVNICVANGLAVIQGDADTDLVNYPDGSFDYVILTRSLQETHKPRAVISEMLRIGRRAIVSFPNFAHWRVRLKLFLTGQMPVTGTLSDAWYETPNIHLCTIRDFLALADELGITVERALPLDDHGRPTFATRLPSLANLLGAQGLFLLSKETTAR